MRYLPVVLTAVALVAGCGSAKDKAALSTPQAHRAEAQAKRIAEQCMRKGGGFKAEFHCAIPPHHGVAFLRCVVTNAPKNLSNQAADESDLVTCGERYR